MTRRPGTFVLHSASRSATGNENGSASSSTVASGAVVVGQPSTRTPSAVGLHVEHEAVDATPSPFGRPHAERGLALDLSRSTRDRDRRRTEEHVRFEQGAEARGDVGERLGVVPRHEEHEQVGTISVELFEQFTRRGADRLERDRMRRERSGVARRPRASCCHGAPV